MLPRVAIFRGKEKSEGVELPEDQGKTNLYKQPSNKIKVRIEDIRSKSGFGGQGSLGDIPLVTWSFPVMCPQVRLIQVCIHCLWATTAAAIIVCAQQSSSITEHFRPPFKDIHIKFFLLSEPSCEKPKEKRKEKKKIVRPSHEKRLERHVTQPRCELVRTRPGPWIPTSLL